MPVHSQDGDLFIVDSETLKAARREHRSIVAAWVAVFLIGAIFWTVLIGWLL